MLHSYCGPQSIASDEDWQQDKVFKKISTLEPSAPLSQIIARSTSDKDFSEFKELIFRKNLFSMKNNNIQNNKILVTGATGYVGGRLVPRLLSDGYRIKAVGRSMEKLKGRPWASHPNLDLAQADIHNQESIKNVINGCSAAFYLVHSMNPEHKDFAGSDRRAAIIFKEAANGSNLKRIIYLGGLGGDRPDASMHLKSREEVGRILQSSRIPTTIFRSAHILGSGSASFEILRYMAERLPVMIVPREVVNTRIQPICIRNVLNYLQFCVKNDETIGRIFDIGGPDIVTYRQLFEIYAEEMDLKGPLFLNPPFRAKKLGKRFGISVAKLVLPMPQSISGPLLDGSSIEVIVEDNSIRKIIPQNLMTCKEAIRRAVQKDSQKIVETKWTDAGKLNPPEWMHKGDAQYAGGTLLGGGFRIILEARPENVWPVISQIGGKNGWYYGDFLWRVRGWMDSLAGGVGLRRGRRHPEELHVGDALDFWRVLYVQPPNRLILLAEMKLPGEAIMDFKIDGIKNGADLRLGTRFRPRGLYGILYWYSLLPFHDLLFGGMLRQVAHRVDRTIIAGPSKFRPGPFSY